MYVVGFCCLFVWRQMALTQVSSPDLGQKASELEASAGHGLSLATKPHGAGDVYQADLLYPVLPVFRWCIWVLCDSFRLHGFLLFEP